MPLFEKVWVVEDRECGKLIGIFSTKEMAEEVVKETVDRSAVLREMLVDDEMGDPQQVVMSGMTQVVMSGTTISKVAIHGGTQPFWTDPETGELCVDPIWSDIVEAKRADQLSRNWPKKSWWRFWE